VKQVKVALLGLGVVGSGTYRILQNKKEYIASNDKVEIEVVKVLEKNQDRLKELKIPKSMVAKTIDEIVEDKEIQIVAEFFGGIEPAKTFLIKCLKSGKSIVTANKEMLAKSWPELEKAAREGNAGIYFEASCVGGVPVIRALTESMQGNNIISLKGIVNGTTNYILSRMIKEKVDYATCLKDAQKLGYAEANPSADVDGFDAMYKNSILSSLAYKKRVPIDMIYREGISNISLEDMEAGTDMGYTLKLLAISKCIDGKIEARVHPAFIPSEHPLAQVQGSFNALFMHGDNVDDVMLYGRGAGSFPTGSAIVSDIVYAASVTEHRRYAWEEDLDINKNDFEHNFISKYYVRILVDDNEGILSAIAAVFSKNKISIKSLVQKDSKKKSVPIVFITHETREESMKNALDEISQLVGVESVAAVIRVED
jgi:homoserine dehydrogenase